MRIETVLKEAQDAHAFANVARAFHLPPDKAGAAVSSMLRELIPHVEKRLQTRRSLAALVALLGQVGYTQVLDTPALLGATHTQVLGTEALKFIAGHAASARIARNAATEAGVSEMIAEYLLPVIAAMLLGALARLSRAGIAAIIGGHADPGASEPTDRLGVDLPRVSGGVGFSGSTGGAITIGPAIAAQQYKALAEDIARTDRPLGVPDPLPAVRRSLQSSLGAAGGAPGWTEWIRRWWNGALGAVRRQRL